VQTSSVDDEGKAVRGGELAREDEKCPVRWIRTERRSSSCRQGWCLA
jgi:hypothetical protein